MPTPTIRGAARAAADAARAYAAADAADAAARAAARAARAATDAARADADAYAAAYAAARAADFAADAYVYAAYAAADAARAEKTLWAEIHADLTDLQNGENVKPVALWRVGDDPFAATWTSVQEMVSADPDGPWKFWLDWYANAREGRHLPLDLWEAIALIDNAVWEAGPEAVAEEIARLQLEYAQKISPNAEDIWINDNGLFEAIPRSDLPAQTLQDARDRIGDVVDLIRRHQTQNQYSALEPDADLLATSLQRHSDNPLRLSEACAKVVRHTLRNIDDGLLPENDNVVKDVLVDLQNTADDVYNFDTQVRETIDARARLRFRALPDEAKSKLGAYTEAVAQKSEPQLALQLREDWLVVETEVEPTQDISESRYRLGSRLSRIIALAKRTGDTVIWTAELGKGLSAIAQSVAKLLGF